MTMDLNMTVAEACAGAEKRDSGAPDGATLPVGTVTFLRTDVEGSMALARTLGPAWDPANAGHLAAIADAVRRHRGVVVRTEGDALFGAFGEAGAAAAAAVEAQRLVHARDWGVPGGLRVRMGLHSGDAHHAGGDYGGFEVNRAARIAATAHGGQIVVSGTTAALIADQLPPGTRLDDLGAHRLRDVPRPESIHQLTVEDLPAHFPPLRTAGGVTGNLPERLTSFLGREAELTDIEGIASAARLITLTGPGGVGKTSLAIEAARVLALAHSDGAWFVPLADVTDPADVPAAIAHGIGLFDGPERPAVDALAAYVSGRSMVIVLDNVEQVLGAADHVTAVVRASPASRVIVTSRAPLHVGGEHEIHVRPLADDGVRLFIERAQAVRPNWEPGPDRPIVEDICALLDNLPLGIELAAARIALLPAGAIRDRLAARLPLPGPGIQDAPGRQRTLESAVAWSYDLLDPARQRLLQELAVFEGGFDLEQVEAMSVSSGGPPDRLDDMLELADRSLIVSVPEPTGQVRFRMLRTIQTFALARLAGGGDEAEVRRRHAESFLDLVRVKVTALGTSRHGATLDRVAPEMANIRAAVRWAIEAEAGELALALAGNLWRFWNSFGLGAEGRRLTETILAMPSATGVSAARSWAAGAEGSLAYWQADTKEARIWYERQVEFAKAAGDEAAIADGLFNLSHVITLSDEVLDAKRRLIEDVMKRFHDAGDARAEARAEWGLCILEMTAGRTDDAITRLQSLLPEFERLDDRQYHAMTVSSLGWAWFVNGDVPRATRYAIDGLLESHAMRDLATMTISLQIGVLAGVVSRRFEDAAAIIGAFEALCERYGVRPPAALSTFVDGIDPFSATRDALSAEAYAVAYERGTRMSLDEAVAKVAALGDVTGDGATEAMGRASQTWWA
jgi:predicted ATPase/class 3 adenylate cyclase